MGRLLQEGKPGDLPNHLPSKLSGKKLGLDFNSDLFLQPPLLWIEA
jgi:hypothetical protein